MNFKYIIHSCEVESWEGFLLWADQAGTAVTAAARNRFSVILLRKVHFSWPKKFCARSRKVFPLNVKLQFCWICPRIRGKEFLCKIESSLSFGKNFPSKADEQFSIDFNFLRFWTFLSFWAVQNTTKLHFNFINLFPIKPTLTCAMEYNKWEGRALCPIQVAPCSGFPFRVEACTSCLVPQINASLITVSTLVVLQAF